MSGPLQSRLAAAKGGSSGKAGPVAGCTRPCSQLWAEVDAQRDKTVAIADPLARNKQITAQYAELYKADHNLEWVGLAGIVSRQAGCAMVKAKDASGSWIPMKSGPADTAYHALADANGKIYGDIYPAAKFYQANGLKRLKECSGGGDGSQRVDPKLVKAFEQIDTGTPAGVRRGSDAIANYEQRDIIQDQVYARQDYKDAFAKNEWWAKRPLGRMMGAEAPELPISTSCTDEGKVPFTGSILNPNARVGYYTKLMDDYGGLSQATRDQMADDLIRQAH